MSEELLFALLMFCCVSGAAGTVLTVYDKIAAKIAQRHRIPEAVLITFGALGGAIPMYLTMLIIRHKTKKPKFSVGFPLMILLHSALAAALMFL